MNAAVSVVMPTVGRPSLATAIASVLDQTTPPLEVLVVHDSPTPLPALPDSSVVRLETLTTGGGVGPSAARNLALRRARGDFVAFLDDDDVWLPNHLETALQFLHQHQEIDIYSSACLMRSPHEDRVEPTVVFGQRGSLISFFYGRTAWARRRRRVHPSSLVARRAVSAITMDEDMRVFEDLWWLFQAEQAGHRVAQVPAVAVICSQDTDRESARITIEAAADWAERLDTVQPGAGANYLVGQLGRTLARSGDVLELDAVANLLHRTSLPADLRIILQLELLWAKLRRAHEETGS